MVVDIQIGMVRAGGVVQRGINELKFRQAHGVERELVGPFRIVDGQRRDAENGSGASAIWLRAFSS